MEKAILKTLIYADIFDYPLKAWEIHKWLIRKKLSLRQVEKVLSRKHLESKLKCQGGYYFIKVRHGLVQKRILKEEHSKKFLMQANLIVQIFKLIPFIKLVGVSGSLAMENASKDDDIDLFIITQKNRIWLSRILILGILEIIRKRRKKTDNKKSAAGKICVNLILEEDQLLQKNKDLYTAHEVLQMKVLWERGVVYSKFLEDNSWAFKFLPNWFASRNNVSSIKYQVLRGKKKSTHNTKYTIANIFVDYIEKLAKDCQLKHIGLPKGKERVTDTALYFHPEDVRKKVLAGFKQKILRYS